MVINKIKYTEFLKYILIMHVYKSEYTMGGLQSQLFLYLHTDYNYVSRGCTANIVTYITCNVFSYFIN